MKSSHCYILKCSDGTYFISSTKKLLCSLWQHQNGEGANYTKKRLPVELVYIEEYENFAVAFAREKQIQGWSQKKKAALIASESNELPKLAKVYQDKASRAFR